MTSLAPTSIDESVDVIAPEEISRQLTEQGFVRFELGRVETYPLHGHRGLVDSIELAEA